MKKAIISTFAAVIMLSVFTTVSAQEWTKAQKEVWQAVDNIWSNLKAGNLDGFAAGFHEKYQGWNNYLPLPVGKQKNIASYRENKDIQKLESYEIEPARITVSENSAVVDYYFSITISEKKDGKSEVKVYSGKNVEFFVKEEGKWLLLGDMTYIKTDGK
ncbi:MAG TPA: nuclear transport factor 2 family protein [Bacteroidales bacterium]|nr:nuclear transport factor 2 family protein [Bacteroidales bacterium]HPT03103.1 nuclear transport factor 2 family protein [Bacteroidales bacterium]